MNYEMNKIYHGFQLIHEEEVKEIKSYARIFTHVKSGARLVHLGNNDDNKVFCIGFRTPPKDDTGVAHILEHSVLCGSKNFDSKDPFTTMSKTSLYTFLNAMTYNDKTIYPIASRNHKDFMNLMHVYLDATLYPKIYENAETLRQEGWRYEIDEKENLIYKGVVYSEMQGALSSPEQNIAGGIYSTLLEGTPYAFESGGDPQYIPDLTQEEFVSFHKQYYHPSNSYIYLYGDEDLDECLKFIDDEYLSKFQEIENTSYIKDKKPIGAMAEKTLSYSLKDDEDDKNKDFLSLNFVLGKSSNTKDYITFKILSKMLLDSSASPIKKAVFDSNIAQCLLSLNDLGLDASKQIILPIAIKNSDCSRKEEYKELIFNTLKDLVQKGIDRNLIEASINSLEFELREASPYGVSNKGLYYIDMVLDSWLYDGDPLSHLKYEKVIEEIRSEVKDNYFEKYIENNLINSNHCSLVILKGEKGLQKKKVKALKDKLQAIKQSFSQDDVRKLKERNEKLKEYQASDDTKEAKDSLPKLLLEDVSTDCEVIPQQVIKDGDSTILCNPIETNGIVYMNLLFDAHDIKEEDIPYLQLLSEVLGKIDTTNKKYTDIINDIDMFTGGVSFYNKVYMKENNIHDYYPKFIVKGKCLFNKIELMLALVKDIICNSSFENMDRIKEIINEAKSTEDMWIMSNGHMVSKYAIDAKLGEGYKYTSLVAGIDYYNFISDLALNFEDKKEEIKEALKRVYEVIINRKNIMISIVADKKDVNESIALINKYLEDIKCNDRCYEYISGLDKERKSFIPTASNVQYVGKGFNYLSKGIKYSGNMMVLSNILTNEYFYPKVRLQGGAYGCFMQISNAGTMELLSYRDPETTRTIDVYNKAYSFLESINYNKEDMNNFIIGAIGKNYRPLTCEAKGDVSVERYIKGITYEDLQKERREILNTTLEDIKAYAPILKAGMEDNFICIVGNQKNIEDVKNEI